MTRNGSLCHTPSAQAWRDTEDRFMKTVQSALRLSDIDIDGSDEQRA